MLDEMWEMLQCPVVVGKRLFSDVICLSQVRRVANRVLEFQDCKYHVHHNCFSSVGLEVRLVELVDLG